MALHRAAQLWIFVIGTALGAILRTGQYLSSHSIMSEIMGVDAPIQGAILSKTAIRQVASCTPTQLYKINEALPDKGGHCSSNQFPWYNRCSISQITGCPNSSAWLEWYYQREQQPSATNNNSNNNNNTTFVAINVGCNKGFDAVNLLRMGSNDDAIARAAWNTSMPMFMRPSNCGQDGDASQYSILVRPTTTTTTTTTEADDTRRRNAVVFCVEPLTGTYTALVEAAKQTQYDQRGLHIRQLALNNEEPNMTLFPKADPLLLGAEKEGGSSCYSKRPSRAARLRENCEAVPTMRLDRMVQHEETLRNSAQLINVLLIDVEGWDFEVLLGGIHTLARTQYLEFEYNWRGMWWTRKDEQPLRQAITQLLNSEELPFTCYWPGNSGQLWRITECWLPHYDGLFWSNVVCVNRVLAPALAERMEQVFLKTVAEE